MRCDAAFKKAAHFDQKIYLFDQGRQGAGREASDPAESPGEASGRRRPPKADGRLSKRESHALDQRIPNSAPIETLASEKHAGANAVGQGARRRWSSCGWSGAGVVSAHQCAGRRLALPQALCDRLAAAGDPEAEVKAVLDEAMRRVVSEMADLPHRVDAKEWARFLAEKSGCRGVGGKARGKRPAEGHDSCPSGVR